MAPSRVDSGQGRRTQRWEPGAARALGSARAACAQPYTRTAALIACSSNLGCSSSSGTASGAGGERPPALILLSSQHRLANLGTELLAEQIADHVALQNQWYFCILWIYSSFSQFRSVIRHLALLVY